MQKLDPTSKSYHDDFHAAHGPAIYDPNSATKYFSDGALITDANSPTFAGYYEPHQEPRDNAARIKKYWQLKKGFNDRAFATLKNQLTGDVVPDDSELEKLKQLAENCRTSDAALVEAEKQFADLSRSPYLEGVEKMNLARAQQQREFQAAVRAIQV